MIPLVATTAGSARLVIPIEFEERIIAKFKRDLFESQI